MADPGRGSSLGGAESALPPRRPRKAISEEQEQEQEQQQQQNQRNGEEEKPKAVVGTGGSAVIGSTNSTLDNTTNFTGNYPRDSRRVAHPEKKERANFV